jgi:hypothetical protein
MTDYVLRSAHRRIRPPRIALGSPSSSPRPAWSACFNGISNISCCRAIVEQLDPQRKVGDLAAMTTLAAILTVFGLIAGGALSDRTVAAGGGARRPSP